ncbi:MAG: hypothetical protein WBX25_09175 [Rhodomicrobium sp.]
MLTAPVRRRAAIKALTASLAMLSMPRQVIAAEEIVFGLTPVLLTNDLDLLAFLQAYLERATGFRSGCCKGEPIRKSRRFCSPAS